MILAPSFLLLVPALACPLEDPLRLANPETIEAEVVGNILGQPLGSGTVADLALDDAFVHRVADRIIRTSFSERYRVIVSDPAAAEENTPHEAPAEGARDTASSEPAEPTAGANESSAIRTAQPSPAATDGGAATPTAAPERRSLSGVAYAVLGGVVLLVLVLAAHGSRRSSKGARP